MRPYGSGAIGSWAEMAEAGDAADFGVATSRGANSTILGGTEDSAAASASTLVIRFPGPVPITVLASMPAAARTAAADGMTRGSVTVSSTGAGDGALLESVEAEALTEASVSITAITSPETTV